MIYRTGRHGFFVVKREIGSVESQFCASFFNSRRAVPIQAPLMRGGAVGKSESRAFQSHAVGPLRPNARGALKLVIGLVKNGRIYAPVTVIAKLDCPVSLNIVPVTETGL